jgi:hypothetical protein
MVAEADASRHAAGGAAFVLSRLAARQIATVATGEPRVVVGHKNVRSPR